MQNATQDDKKVIEVKNVIINKVMAGVIMSIKD